MKGIVPSFLLASLAPHLLSRFRRPRRLVRKKIKNNMPCAQSRFQGFSPRTRPVSRAQPEWNDDVTSDCRRARVNRKMNTFCFDCSYNAPAITGFFTTNFTLFVKSFARTGNINDLRPPWKDDLLYEGQGFSFNHYIVFDRRLYHRRMQRHPSRR